MPGSSDADTFRLWRRCVLAQVDRTGPSELALLNGQSRRQWGQLRPLWAVQDVLGPEEYCLYKSGHSPERIRRSGLCEAVLWRRIIRNQVHLSTMPTA